MSSFSREARPRAEKGEGQNEDNNRGDKEWTAVIKHTVSLQVAFRIYFHIFYLISLSTVNLFFKNKFLIKK